MLLDQVEQWLPESMDVGGLQELLVQAIEGFATEAGLRVARCLLEEELRRRCGERYARSPDREATRFGSQPGVLILGRQKVPIAKPRARYRDNRGEVLLETYERLQRPAAQCSGQDGARCVVPRLRRGARPGLQRGRCEENRASAAASSEPRPMSWRSCELDRSRTCDWWRCFWMALISREKC